MTITFDNSKAKQTNTSVVKPVLHINKITFNTKDKNWVSRLVGTSITIKFACVDKDKKERKTSQEQLSFSAFITPYHIRPDLLVDKQFSFEDSFSITKDSECKQWKTTIELNNLDFKNDESLSISVIDKDHIDKRVKDWKRRINDLYYDVKSWLPKEYSLKSGSPITMFEGLMQQFGVEPTELNTVDIFKDNSYILSIKPKGLWIIGANGRMDIISTKGNYMLIDRSDQFDEPKWRLLPTSGRPEKTFSKTEFLRLINALS